MSGIFSTPFRRPRRCKSLNWAAKRRGKEVKKDKMMLMLTIFEIKKLP